jgi:tyrosyl-tRNA synthetase
LSRHRDCRVQLGGSDQWGNITAGIDLVRRRGLPAAHGLTWPLMTKADGSKFGKTASGAGWLSADRTTPFAFFQYWVQTDDRDVAVLLRQLTLLRLDEIDAVLAEHAASPERRLAQRRLAEEITELVHGPDALLAASEATDIVFGRASATPSARALALLVDEIPTSRIARGDVAPGMAVVDLLVACGAASSKSDARRTLEQHGITLNGNRPASSDATIDLDDLAHERFVLVRRGKKQVFLVVAG